MSFCCSCSESMSDGDINNCIGCQKLIHSWCGAPCFDQNGSNIEGLEIGRACFPCYKGLYGVEYSHSNDNGLESTAGNPLKRQFDSTDSGNAVLSPFNEESPSRNEVSLDSSFLNSETGNKNSGEIKTTNQVDNQSPHNITLETFFEFSENRNDGFAKCKLCVRNKVLAVKKYSYTSVKYHLERYHQNEYKLYLSFFPDKREKNKPFKILEVSSFNRQHFSKIEAIRCAVRFSVAENLSFKSLENKFFQEIFQRSIRPNDRKSYIGRNCFNKEFIQYYNEAKTEKTKILQDVDSKISITLDIWNSPNQVSFLGIIAHWIDQKFELHYMILSYIPIKKLRCEAGLNLKIEACLKAYNIQDKILGISLDNSAPNLVAIEHLNASTSTSILKKNQSPCLAHIFHLAAQAYVSTIKQEYIEVDEQPVNFFYKITTLLDSVRGSKKNMNATLSVSGDQSSEKTNSNENTDSIKDNHFIFREFDFTYEEEKLLSQKNNGLEAQQSPGANQNLDPISKLMFALELLNSSPHRKNEFIKLQQFKDIKPSVVVLDARARWNSIFKLIDWALVNKDPLVYFMVQEKFVFTDHDWEFVFEVKKFLALFDEKTNSVTGQKFPTISKALLAFEEVLLLIKETNYPNGSILSQALANCYKKLLKFSYFLKNDIHIMGIILDPSLKDTFCIAYNWSEKDTQEAKFKMNCIYEDYAGPAQIEADNSALNSTKKPRAVAFRESIKPLVENELKTYLSDLSDLENDNVLSYWKLRSTVFPTLGKIARDYLAVCATTLPIESEFSSTRDTFDFKKLHTNSDFTVKFMEMKSWESQLKK